LKRSQLLFQDRKDVLRASQELARPHISQAQGYERINLVERLFFKKRVTLGHSAQKRKPREVFPQDSFHHA
jgi:hypothetical protein